MFPPHLSHPTIAIIGLVQAVGAVMPISEMQCRWFAKIMKGEFNYFLCLFVFLFLLILYAALKYFGR